MQLAPSELAGIQKWAEEETAAGAIPMLPFNTDGIDPGVGAKDVFIKNLTAENFDDVIAVKPCNGDCAGRRRLHAASTPAVILPIPTFPFSLYPLPSRKPPPSNRHPHPITLHRLPPAALGMSMLCTENIVVENSKIFLGVGLSIGSVNPKDPTNCIKDIVFQGASFK